MTILPPCAEHEKRGLLIMAEITVQFENTKENRRKLLADLFESDSLHALRRVATVEVTVLTAARLRITSHRQGFGEVIDRDVQKRMPSIEGIGSCGTHGRQNSE
jgi:hypothetical protein